MDVKTKVLVSIFLLALAGSVSVLFWKYFVKEDYVVVTEETPLADPFWAHFEISIPGMPSWLSL